MEYYKKLYWDSTDENNVKHSPTLPSIKISLITGDTTVNKFSSSNELISFCFTLHPLQNTVSLHSAAQSAVKKLKFSLR